MVATDLHVFVEIVGMIRSPMERMALQHLVEVVLLLGNLHQRDGPTFLLKSCIRENTISGFPALPTVISTALGAIHRPSAAVFLALSL